MRGDAGKKIKGKKRHLLVDTEGLLLCAIMADMQDRDGGVLLMSTMFGLFPFLLKLYADSGYWGRSFDRGLRVCRQINVEIVKRTDVGKFVRLLQAMGRRGPSPGSTGAAVSPRTGCLNRNGLVPVLGLRPTDDPKVMSETR